MYGNWVNFVPDISKWTLFTATIVFAADTAITFILKVSDR